MLRPAQPRLALVVMPAWALAGRIAGRAVRHKLRRLSGCARRRGTTVRKMIVLRTVPPEERPHHMDNPHLTLIGPATVNRTVTPTRAKNSELRSREYLTTAEIEALIAAARQ